MAFDYTKHRPHPTKYRGVQFRSRLEARWAAFFDHMKIEWQYEPMDLGSWSPDFAIRRSDCWDDYMFGEARPWRLVEVKPLADITAKTDGKYSYSQPTDPDVLHLMRRIGQANPWGEYARPLILGLGLKPPTMRDGVFSAAMGWAVDHRDTKFAFLVRLAKERGDEPPAFDNRYAEYWISSFYGVWAIADERDWEVMSAAWAEAANAVQWVPT